MSFIKRESSKDILAAAFVFIVASLVTDQIDGELHWRHGNAMACAIGAVAVVAYSWLWSKTSPIARQKRHSRDALIVGLVFSTGLVAGIIRLLAEGWDWSEVGLIVPALMAWFCFKVLFRAPADVGLAPKSSERS